MATVAEIAATSVAAVRVFEKLGIDYCCGGKRPLDEVCAEKGLDVAAVARQLDQARAGTPEDGVDWTTAPLTALIAHIVGTHHEFLKSELPAIAERLAKVVRVYGERDAATLTELPAIFGGLRAELELHLRKEEMVLFPAIGKLEAARNVGAPLPAMPFGSLANPIAMMEHEHTSAGDALGRLRQLTNGYAIPEHACNTYRALLNGLADLERDLHTHIHLENNILFPRAVALEDGAAATAA